MRRKIVDDWKRLVYGEVYVPYRIDTDLEFATPEEIEKAAHYFMEQSRTHNVDAEHNFKPSDNIVVQSYIAKEGDPDGFVPGSWIAVGLIKDDAQWELVKSGKLNGWSMAGTSDKIPRKVRVSALVSATLKTEESTADTIENHTHDLVLKFDDGRVIPTTTSETLGHSHEVIATTATEIIEGHAHRFNLDWTEDSPNVQKEEKEIEVMELVDIKPQWLSLVEHAATRRAFKMIKQEDDSPAVEKTEEVQPVDRVVHAIISDLEFDDVLKLENLGWVVPSEIRFEERIRIGKNNKYVLIPSQSFVKGSLETRDTEAENVKIVVGVLKEESAKNAISAGEVETMDEKTVLELLDRVLAEKVSEIIKTELASIREELQKSVEGLKAEFDAFVTPKLEEALKAQTTEIEEVKKSLETISKSHEELVSKTDELAQKAVSLPGSSIDESSIAKSEEPAAGGWFINHRNPAIQKILAS